MATSMSCVASPLPREQHVDVTLADQRGDQVARARCAPAPDRRPAPPVRPASGWSRKRSAISCTSSTFGFSLDTLLPMKAKTGGCSRGRSSGCDLDPLVADDDLLARLDVGQRDGPRALAARVDGDRAVHLGPLDTHPLPVQAHLGVQVRGRVEVLGKDAVGGRRLELHLLDLVRASRRCAAPDPAAGPAARASAPRSECARTMARSCAGRPRSARSRTRRRDP